MTKGLLTVDDRPALDGYTSNIQDVAMGDGPGNQSNTAVQENDSADIEPVTHINLRKEK
jgi:hypothetical protein